MLLATDADAAIAPAPARRHTTPRSSLVQQKLQTALLAAEKAAQDLAEDPSHHSAKRRSSVSINAILPIVSTEPQHEDNRPRTERAVARYRQAAAAVSFTDSASSFSYTSNFMPGVHFYTFLASKAGASATQPPLHSGAQSPEWQSDEWSAARPQRVRPRSAKPGNRALESSRPPSSSAASSNRSALRLWVPDTVVYGETGRAIWVYSDPVTGCVHRSTEFTDKQVLERFAAITASDDGGNNTHGSERVVVFKEPIVTSALAPRRAGDAGSGALLSQGSQLRLLSLAELKTLLSNISSTSRKSFAIQQFVKCNGAKAFVLRSVYEAGKPAYAWMVSNTVAMQDPSAAAPHWSVSQALDASASPTKAEASAPGRRASTIGTRTTANGSASPRMSVATNGSDASGSIAAAAEATGSAATATTATAVPLVNRLCTSVQVDRACTFVKLNERACATTSELTQRVVKHLERRLGIQLQTLVADFVKDADGTWWLLQIKAFQVKSRAHPGRPVSLPVRLRHQYLDYRDSQLLEEGSDSEGERSGRRAGGRSAAALIHAHRQTRKLVQCKCCMAAYPTSELSFKMTLKMINDMLQRVRARVPPDAPAYTFLAPALARELPDASLAYESWSVCSFCYAIYERDQQLQRIEASFSAVLGVPSAETAARGLSRVHETRSFALDPSTTATVLPAQVTLCRLILVVNGIYDIPAELYDAETSASPSGASPSAVNRSVPTSRLFLRITALGYTECVPINAADIVPANERAPRGTAQRRASSALSLSADFGGDDDIEGEGGSEDKERRGSNSSTTSAARPRSASQTKTADVVTAASDCAASSPTPGASDAARNYSLPLHLIRTMQFFAPRTPLQAKLKETSGITPFLTDANSIHIQLVRATDPPLEDPTAGQARRRPNIRRAALVAEATATATDSTAAPPASHGRRRHQVSHTVVLGSTKIRMAQFQSAYVTKMDYYACMSFTGEMLNVKGNVGLERLRYVDTKLLTSQFRLRVHNGVFIPDESFAAADPLSSEWMDCLRLSGNARKLGTGNDSGAESDADDREHAQGGRSGRETKCRRSRPPLAKRTHDVRQATRSGCPIDRGMSADTHLTASTTSLMSADNEEMDQELEQMIDRANQRQQQERLRELRGDSAMDELLPCDQVQIDCDRDRHSRHTDSQTADAMRQQLLSSLPATPSAFDASVAALMNKTQLSPQPALAAQQTSDADAGTSTVALGGLDTPCESGDRRLWTLVIHLNQAHNLVSREHAVCRWECSYSLFGQKRSAIERHSPASPSVPRVEETSATDRGVQFTCTHKFFATGSRTAMRAFVAANARVALQLRNDMYASTRRRRQGEFLGLIDISRLLHAAHFDAVIDLSPSSDAPPVTPREAEAIAGAGSPYLSLSAQLSDVAIDSEEASARIERDFVELGRTSEGLVVLKKLA